MLPYARIPNSKLHQFGLIHTEYFPRRSLPDASSVGSKKHDAVNKRNDFFNAMFHDNKCPIL
ncbi:hypothetical protein D3C77_451990 [compost metagenome]